MATVLYRAFNQSDDLLYVGISLRAAQRVHEHKKLSGWFQEVSRLEFEWFETRQSALVAEREAIKSERPKYNKHHNGKKSEQEICEDDFDKDELSFDISGEKVAFRKHKLKPLYKVSEVADLFSVSASRVKDWIETDKIGAIVIAEHWRHVRGHEEKVLIKDYRVSGWQILDFIDAMGGR